MRHFSVSVDIAAAPARVWEVMLDVERWHEWTASVAGIRMLDKGPLTVGTRAMVRQPKFPPALWRVTAIDPGKGFEWVSPGPGFQAVGRHEVVVSPGGSRATLSLELTGPLGGIFGTITGGITQRYIGYEAAGLRARSEDPGFRRVESREDRR